MSDSDAQDWLADELRPDDITEEVARYVHDELRYEHRHAGDSSGVTLVYAAVPFTDTDDQEYQGIYDIDGSRLYTTLTTVVEQYDDPTFLKNVGEQVGDGIVQAFKEERRNHPSDTEYRFEGDSVDRAVINGLAETIAANLFAQELQEEYSDTDGIDKLTEGLWRNPGNV